MIVTQRRQDLSPGTYQAALTVTMSQTDATSSHQCSAGRSHGRSLRMGALILSSACHPTILWLRMWTNYFPSSTLNEIVPFLWHQTLLIRSTFPPQWTLDRPRPHGSPQRLSRHPQLPHPPLWTQTPQQTLTVVSAITMPTIVSTPPHQQQQGAIHDTMSTQKSKTAWVLTSKSFVPSCSIACSATQT